MKNNVEQGNFRGPEHIISRLPHLEYFTAFSFGIRRLDVGNVVPVGQLPGGTYSSFLDIDTGLNHPVLEKMSAKLTPKFIDSGEKIIDELNITLNSHTFSAIAACSIILGKEYPINNVNNRERTKIYWRAPLGVAKISDFLESGNLACSERTVLAQLFLQEQGLNPSYFSGEVLWNKDSEFADPHDFIVLEEDGRTVIYDPANPLYNHFPSIYDIHPNFSQLIRQGKPTLVKATIPFISPVKTTYYGVGNCTNVLPEYLVD